MARLLLDENLSPRLVSRLAAAYPGSQHVRQVGLQASSDQAIWEYAKAESYVIVTKDDDFSRLSFLRGAPPKVIWLLVGNAGTEPVATLLDFSQPTVAAFLADPEESLLVLRVRPR